MKIEDIKLNLNKPVRYKLQRNSLDINQEYKLVAGVIRQNETNGEYYYQVILLDPNNKNSTVVASLDDIEPVTSRLQKAMICRECGAQMYIDDRDRKFKGNYDNYWNCPNCQTGCIEEIRFNQKYRELWHSENNNEVKDEIIMNVGFKGGK